jgi:hypothetical protein
MPSDNFRCWHISGTSSLCLHQAWTDEGLEWLEAMDQVPLLEMQTTPRSLCLERHLAAAIRHRPVEILGPPIAQAARPMREVI